MLSMSEVARGCSHFADFKRTMGLKSYHIIFKYLVKPAVEARKLKVNVYHVFICHHDVASSR